MRQVRFCQGIVLRASRRQDSALDLRPGGSVSMHAAIAGLLHYRCNGQAYKTSRRAGVLESLNVMVREAKTAVVGMEACRRWPCLMPSTLLPFEANHAQ